MFSRQQTSYLCKRILAGYTEEWQRKEWHHFTPLAILHCPHLKWMVGDSLKAMQSSQRFKDDPDAWQGYNEVAVNHGAEWIAQRFSKYLYVRSAWNTSPCFGEIPTPADVGHSALLSWLIRGRQPTPLPPPVFYSYPSYAAASGEAVEAYVEELCFLGESNPTLVINQNGKDFSWYDRGRGLITHVPTRLSSTRHYYQLQGRTLKKVRLDQLS